jgi:hypothetical protein
VWDLLATELRWPSGAELNAEARHNPAFRAELRERLASQAIGKWVLEVERDV